MAEEHTRAHDLAWRASRHVCQILSARSSPYVQVKRSKRLTSRAAPMAHTMRHNTSRSSVCFALGRDGTIPEDMSKDIT